MKLLNRMIGKCTELPAQIERTEPKLKVSMQAVAAASIAPTLPIQPSGEFKRPEVMPGVIPADRESEIMAFDQAMSHVYDYASNAWSGMQFIGYPHLAELSQKPEFRKMSEVIAKEMTREWIELESKGDDDKQEKLEIIENAMRRHKLRKCFRNAALQDGLFGRSQIYIDVKTPSGVQAWSDPNELQSILAKHPAKITKGSLSGFKVIEPVWTTPYLYNSDNPMRADFYKPTSWFILGKMVHASRLLNFVSREVPDILKPAYNFGGISMTQLAMPYVNNWLKTREAVARLIDGFSIGVLRTNMSAVLNNADPGQDLYSRLDLFNRMRSNRGIWAINHEDEDFKFENVPLSGLDSLQNQSQEQMASVSSIPLVKLLGITPSGLNASSDGEIRVFYDDIQAMQESLFREPLQTCLEFIQLSEFGEIDPDITFSFVPLWQMSEKEQAEVRKFDAETDALLVGLSAVSPSEVRARLASDETNSYHSLELTDEDEDGIPDNMPKLPDDDDAGGYEQDEPEPAKDSEFEEGKHPRDDGGKFAGGESGGAASIKARSVVRLTGKEIDEAATTKELRQKALEYASRFIGKSFRNAETGNDILVGKSGVKHTLSHAGLDLIRSIPAIPNLIASAELLNSEPDKHGDANIKSVETYTAKLEIEGAQREIVMTVKHHSDGCRYYDHGFMRNLDA